MKWFKEHFRDPIPGTPATPNSGGRSSGRTPAITPGAMSMAGAGTPGGFGRSAPYTPTANTPFMTPFNTPGPSVTPRSSGFGSGSELPAHQATRQLREPVVVDILVEGSLLGAAHPGSMAELREVVPNRVLVVPPGRHQRAEGVTCGEMWQQTGEEVEEEEIDEEVDNMVVGKVA